MTVEIKTVLVPVDGTDASARAFEYAVELADRYGACVHVLHVIDEDLARSVQSGTVDAEAVAADQRSFLSTVTDEVAEADETVPITASVVIGFSSTELRRNPVTVVLEAATDVGADFIVVPRESIREEPSAMLGKVAEHVLSYATQPVLSV